MRAPSRPKISWLLTISALLLFGCGQGSETFVQPPPPEVTISLPEKKQVTDYLEFTGNTQALESVEIRGESARFFGSYELPAGTEGQGRGSSLRDRPSAVSGESGSGRGFPEGKASRSPAQAGKSEASAATCFDWVHQPTAIRGAGSGGIGVPVLK